MRKRMSVLLGGALILVIVARALPGEAAAGWGNENWGPMFRGGVTKPITPASSLPELSFIELMAVGASPKTPAWLLEKKGVWIGLATTLLVIVFPVGRVAGEGTPPITLIGGTTADADRMNAKVNSIRGTLDNNNARVTTVESQTTTSAAGTTAAATTANSNLAVITELQEMTEAFAALVGATLTIDPQGWGPLSRRQGQVRAPWRSPSN